jgi:hypothetical protein
MGILTSIWLEGSQCWWLQSAKLPAAVRLLRSKAECSFMVQGVVGKKKTHLVH